MRRAQPTADGAVRLRSRHVYILPTGRGWLFAVLLVALLFAGINYGNNLIFALTFVLAGIGHAALLLTWRNLAGLELATRPAEPVFAGATAHFPALLKAGRTPRDAIRLSFPAQAAVTADLDGTRSTRIDVPFHAARRGVLQPGTLRVYTEFPLGLFHAWSLVETGSRSLVYPRPLAGFPLPTGEHSRSEGAAQDAAGADDFAGLREYQPGDSLNRISWKTSARTGDLHAKEFLEEASAARCLDWNAVPVADIEQRLGIMTSWVIEAAQKGERWGMRLPGSSLAPECGHVHRDRCLALLACFGADA